MSLNRQAIRDYEDALYKKPCPFIPEDLLEWLELQERRHRGKYLNSFQAVKLLQNYFEKQKKEKT